MFCPKCGKPVHEEDNFCRFCGNRLVSISNEPEEDVELPLPKAEPQKIIKPSKSVEPSYREQVETVSDDEELVLYIAKKHYMAMFWPIFLTPFFLIYFWNIFLNTHSFLSWLVTIGLLVVIIYPIARYNSDKIVITTKCAHIKIGVLNPEEIEIPINKLDMIDITQSSIGRMLDYGNVSFCANGEKYDYTYIQSPEELQYIIDAPERFVKEALEEEE